MQIILKKDDIIEEKIIILNNKDSYHHIVNVLRKQNKDNITLITDENIIYKTCIENIDKIDKKIFLNILNIEDKKIDLKINLNLVQGLPKKDKMEYIIEKAVELGVNNIIPIEFERSVVTKKDINENKLRRWELKLISATEQSRRKSMPKIFKVLNLTEFLDSDILNKENSFVILLYENKINELDFKAYLQKIKKMLDIDNEKNEVKEYNIYFIIGPEGGISEKEIIYINDKCKNIGIDIMCAHLGDNILRTETASLKILSILTYEFEKYIF